jgi:ubiquinone/menaquinone biosynthesis C-methylase UbiE
MSNYEHYKNVEFDQWAYREGLTYAEEFLTENYLSKGKRTLEAGTGGGRIVLSLLRKGFTDLHGFDFVETFIEAARNREHEGRISFEVQDARKLTYPSDSFDQLIYLQQVLCFIEDPEGRMKGMEEAYRILKPGGVIIFSFLCFESRRTSSFIKLFNAWLRMLRVFRHREYPMQLQPWLKVRNKLNFKALADSGPHVYYYSIPEAAAALEKAGFTIKGAATEAQLQSKTLSPVQELVNKTLDGACYFVCTKQ